jgi:hypothetical protein
MRLGAEVSIAVLGIEEAIIDGLAPLKYTNYYRAFGLMRAEQGFKVD